MVAIGVTGPPHWKQAVMSIANTRLSNWAQLKRACVEDEEVSPSASAGADSEGSLSIYSTLRHGLIQAAHSRTRGRPRAAVCDLAHPLPIGFLEWRDGSAR